MPIEYLYDAVEIRAYFRDQQAKAKVAKKKAIDQKRRLSKVQEVIRKVDREIEHF